MSIQKLLLAASIGSVLWISPAQAVNVEIYGKLYPYLIYERGQGATEAGTPVATLAATPAGVNGLLRDNTGMSAGNSRLGFRGDEELTEGLKAIFQLEAGVGVDSGEGGNGKIFWSRDTFVGLDGYIGTVRAGIINTIFKDYGDTIGMLGVSSGTFMSTSDVFRKTGFGTKSASSFHLRVPNTVRYESPEFVGLQAGLQYSMYEAKTSTRNPRVVSMGLKYDEGPLYVAVSYEIHYDIFGGSLNARSSQRNSAATDPTNSTDTALQFTVEYRLNKDHKFEFDAMRKEYKEDATVIGRFNSYQNYSFLVAMENRWTEHWTTSAHWVLASRGSCTLVGAPCTTEGLEANEFAIGAGYSFTKNTMLFAAATRVQNGKSARYNNSELGSDPNPGEDISIAALGLMHKF